MEQRLTIITLGVEDLTGMTAFYREVFGWEPTDDSNENITFFKLNGILLSLFGKEALADDAGVEAAGRGFKGFSLAHNVASDAEVDRVMSELEEKGVEIVRQPEKVFWGGYRGYIRDPEGHLWEIAHNPFLELDQQGNVK
ncbi:MAG: VOC family protein [Balneolaceae bacterium]|nr:VOC family protein [Balneolaceae bacterium]